MKKSSVNYKYLLLYCLLLSLPLLSYQGKYHGDEKFYTDAAYRMVSTGEYLTPYYASGELRFRKPILNYWLVAASYKLLGVNPFADRFAQLLCAVGTLWILFVLGKEWCDRETAMLATALYMSNPQFLDLSTRAMTDMPLAFFMALSALGFVRLCFLRRRHWLNFALFYGGGALAIQTKGAFGGWFVLYALGYVAFRSLRRRKDVPAPLTFLHLPTLTLAAVIALSWYAAIWWKYGDGALLVFINDQAGERFGGYRMNLLLRFGKNTMQYLLGWLQEFLPWSLLLLVALFKDRSGVLQACRKHAGLLRFSAGWMIFVALPLIFSNRTCLRWMFPGYLLTALMFAAILTELARQPRSRYLQHLSVALFWGIALAGVLSAGFGLPVSSRLFWGAVLIAGPALLGIRCLRLSHVQTVLLCLALLIFSGSRVNDLLMRPVFFQAPAPALVAFIRSHLNIDAPKVALVTDREGFRFHPMLRSASGADFKMSLIAEETALTDLKDFDVVIRHTSQTLPGNRENYVSTTKTFGYWRWKGKHILSLLLGSASAEDVYAKRAVRFEVLIAKSLWKEIDVYE